MMSSNISESKKRPDTVTCRNRKGEKGTVAEKNVNAIKAALGEDFEAYQEFKAQKDLREKKATAKKKAEEMISEGGKYYDSYHRLDEQCSAIWNKAVAEAKAAVGLKDDEKEA